LSPGSSISKNIKEKKFNVTQPDFNQIVSQIIGFSHQAKSIVSQIIGFSDQAKSISFIIFFSTWPALPRSPELALPTRVLKFIKVLFIFVF
jgi:hypothetical protein